MHQGNPEPGERLAKFLPRGAEGDTLDRPPVARDRAQAQIATVSADGVTSASRWRGKANKGSGAPAP